MADANSKQLSPWAKDERGKSYGRLTVVEVAGKQGGQLLWLCQCECGNLTKVTGGDLRRGTTVSCGCYRKSAGGMIGSTEYRTWKEMKRRCYNKNNPDYHNYGGRGIVICDKWRESFTAFYADMGPKPFPEATIDRIDNDGNYEPSNCRWASPMEQGANMRKNRWITYNGETLHVRAWARKLGIPHCTILQRLNRGWTADQILSKTTPNG